MAQSLRRISPRASGDRSKPSLAIVTHPAAAPANNQTAENAEQKTGRHLNKLQKLQQGIEELLLLSTAQHCLEASSEGEVAGQHAFDVEVKKLMSEISEFVSSDRSQEPTSLNDTKCLTRHRAGTSRIQLRLSKPLVRILKAFAKAQRRPSVVVEKTMWKDAQIRDAAAILGISPPKLVRKTTAK